MMMVVEDENHLPFTVYTTMTSLVDSLHHITLLFQETLGQKVKSPNGFILPIPGTSSETHLLLKRKHQMATFTLRFFELLSPISLPCSVHLF